MALLKVHVQPGARTTAIGEWDADGALRIRLQAPAREGRANAALVELLAARLGVPKSALRIERGLTGRRKLVSIEGLDEEDLRRSLQ